MKAKVLLYDLEVSRDIVAGYGNKWDFKVVKVIRHQELMCFAYKWLGDKKINYVSRHDFPTYKRFVQFLAHLQDEADIVIAHNAAKFDNKMSNRFFVKDEILPPAPYKTIDTLQVARSKFKFPGNSLRELGEFLELGDKEKITYADLEDDFMTDKPARKTLRLMKRYTVKDVELLEKIYLRFRPWISNHPNLGDYAQVDGVCPKCESKNVTPYGSSARRHGRVRAFRCLDCGGRCNENTLKGGGRLVNAQ
jgi:hypothetical protein